MRTGNADPGTGEQNRAFGVSEHRDQLPRRSAQGVSLERAIVFDRRIEAAQAIGIDHRRLNVDRNVEPHRTGSSILRQPQRLFNQEADLGGVGDQRRELGDRGDHRDDVGLLIAKLAKARRVRAQGFALHLARQDDHRDRIGVSAVDPVERVDPARPGGDVERGEPARKAGVAFCRHRQRLLVMTADIAQPFGAAECVVEVHRPAASQHEHIGDAVLHEARGDIVGQADGHVRFECGIRCRRPGWPAIRQAGRGRGSC